MHAFKFGSKAQTIKRLEAFGLTCIIPKNACHRWEAWCERSASVLVDVAKMFQNTLIAVRSSAAIEDGRLASQAGAYLTLLDVNPANPDELRGAIDEVFKSYPQNCSDDEVFIQEMVTDIEVSGVILTRCVDDGSPYYVLSYDEETGCSGHVTGGKGRHKTVFVYRGFKAEYCVSRRVRAMLSLAQEIERVCGAIPLDIEFALDRQGVMHLLQVRRICTINDWHPDTEFRVSRLIPHVELFVSHVSARKKGLFGKSTIYGNMPDWNPAELIGPIPSPLAASLFRHLITASAWSVGRQRMGYRELPRTELMILIGGRAYIDVRASFNSFLPYGISETIGEKLIDAWLDRLAHTPSLHDKVEFEVAQTVRDFSFEQNFLERYPDVLTSEQRKAFEEVLLKFTNTALDLRPRASLPLALADIEKLAGRQLPENLFFATESPAAQAGFITTLLDDCYVWGTVPFTIVARHGFIAEAFLRSAIVREAVSKERVDRFKASFRTIIGDLARDSSAVHRGTMPEALFMDRYGHLRPGTFDILSPCYRDRTDLFTSLSGDNRMEDESRPFFLTPSEKRRIEQLLDEAGVSSLDAHGLLRYAQLAIQGREYAKFVFTRHLSAALEAIAAWGSMHNLGRKDLSCLKIEDVLNNAYASTRKEMTTFLMHKVEQASVELALARELKLSYLVRGVHDVHVVPVHRSEPNFITSKIVKGRISMLLATTVHYDALKGKIICIENADPGFDWIFTKGIAGLITKYGGANSHMAIRCAERRLPAAIGCGEDLFERIMDWSVVELNCANGYIRNVDLSSVIFQAGGLPMRSCQKKQEIFEPQRHEDRKGKNQEIFFLVPLWFGSYS